MIKNSYLPDGLPGPGFNGSMSKLSAFNPDRKAALESLSIGSKG